VFSRIGARLWNVIPCNARELSKWKFFKSGIENELLSMLDKENAFVVVVVVVPGHN